jgi:hypothetical protein
MARKVDTTEAAARKPLEDFEIVDDPPFHSRDDPTFRRRPLKFETFPTITCMGSIEICAEFRLLLRTLLK